MQVGLWQPQRADPGHQGGVPEIEIAEVRAAQPLSHTQLFPSAQSAGAGVAGFSDAFAILTAPGSNQVPPPIPRTPPAQL